MLVSKWSKVIPYKFLSVCDFDMKKYTPHLTTAFFSQSFSYKKSCGWLKCVHFHALIVKRFGYSRRYSKKPRLLWSVLFFLNVRLTLGPPTESALCCGQWRKSSRLCAPSPPTLLAGDPGHPRGESGWGSGCQKAVVRDDRSCNGCNQCRYFTLKSICEIPRVFL